MNGAASGFLIVLFAGGLQGTVLAPMSYLKRWKWENTWLIYSFFAYLLLPWLFAFTTIPHILSVLRVTPVDALLRTAVLGFGWGIAVVLFGLGCEMLGLALGYSIILGLGASVGAMVPLIEQHPEQLWTHTGVGTMAGVLLLIVAVALFSVAGKKRDAIVHRDDTGCSITIRQNGAFFLGLALCILCGLSNPLINIAFAYGSDIQAQAVSFGADPKNAGNAVWLIIANAGYAPSLFYSLYLLMRNKSWNLFGKGTTSYWLLPSVMGLIWISGTVFYGVGVGLLGPLGPVIGWPMLMSTMVLAATFWGFLSGEWKGIRGLPRGLCALGLVLLVVAMFTVGWATRL